MTDSSQSTASWTAMTPCITVPADEEWEFFEFLSWQRVRATFDGDALYLTVYFPSLDQDAARELIADWHHFRQSDRASDLPWASNPE